MSKKDDKRYSPLEEPVQRYMQILRVRMDEEIEKVKDYDDKVRMHYIMSAAYIQFLDEHLQASADVDEANFKKKTGFSSIYMKRPKK